ncbi:MAG: hypothetical protein GX154_04725 [Clostridiales bacterium]|nr:hypothetical protein [Clostridiales bacterium]
MVVADNRAYDYSDEYLYNVPLYEEQKKPKSAAKKNKKSKPHILTVMIVFAVSIVMISHYACIAEINYNINRLEKEFKEVEKENSLLSVKLAQAINLQSLEKVALDDLHMQYPGSEQIVYVNVTKPLPQNDAIDRTFYSKKDVLDNKYIAKVKSLINIFISYLD